MCDGWSESAIYAGSGSTGGGGGGGVKDLICDSGRGFESGVLRRNKGEAIYGVGELSL